ncbi:MAG: GNAT family N-acetyltransferase [Alphaproteobacteria bacterium]|nr:GNAT family N-acetyltransferase [Alphaproteobacteria bacterium]
MTIDRPRNVLFLCTGNSARSIIAEVVLRARGGDRFNAFSAGSFPRGEVNPFTLDLLEDKGLPTKGLRSKSWTEFAAPGAPPMDFVITVCDQAAGESCPIWPGRPIAAHWGFPDPAAVEGSDAARREAFVDVFGLIESRVRRFCALPLAELSLEQTRQALRSLAAAPAIALRPALAADAPALRALLTAASLPTDLDAGWFPGHVVLAEADGRIAGAAGFELAGDAALLRSVVVDPRHRGGGLGADLVHDRLAAMARRGCHRAYLLTTDAAGYFARLGFSRIERSAAPEALQRLGQFAATCPASATCMTRAVGA